MSDASRYYCDKLADTRRELAAVRSDLRDAKVVNWIVRVIEDVLCFGAGMFTLWQIGGLV